MKEFFSLTWHLATSLPPIRVAEIVECMRKNMDGIS